MPPTLPPCPKYLGQGMGGMSKAPLGGCPKCSKPLGMCGCPCPEPGGDMGPGVPCIQCDLATWGIPALTAQVDSVTVGDGPIFTGHPPMEEAVGRPFELPKLIPGPGWAGLLYTTINGDYEFSDLRFSVVCGADGRLTLFVRYVYASVYGSLTIYSYTATAPVHECPLGGWSQTFTVVLVPNPGALFGPPVTVVITVSVPA